MLYSEFIQKAKNLTIAEADNGLFYLEPEWHLILLDNQLTLKAFTDVKCGWDDIENILKLEVEKRNTVNSKFPYVTDWLYEIITAQIEPAILQEETEYIKQVMEFMKENHKGET